MTPPLPAPCPPAPPPLAGSPHRPNATRAWRSVEEDALRGVDAQLHETLGMEHRQLQHLREEGEEQGEMGVDAVEEGEKEVEVGGGGGGGGGGGAGVE